VLSASLAIMICAWSPVAPPPALLSLAGLMATLNEIMIGLSLGFVLQLSLPRPRSPPK
jgi:flagellar biosynthetic protein FliR